MALPLVPGLTETSEASVPLHERLVEFLARIPGSGRDDVAEAIGRLESASRREGDERMRTRIKLALSCLRGEGKDEGEDDAY